MPPYYSKNPPRTIPQSHLTARLTVNYGQLPDVPASEEVKVLQYMLQVSVQFCFYNATSRDYNLGRHKPGVQPKTFCYYSSGHKNGW